MGFGSFLKKVGKKGASAALKTAATAATGGLGGVAIGAVKLATNKEDRVNQIKGALIKAATGDKLQAVAELLDDIASFSKLVKAARADGNITQEEIAEIMDAVEELQADAEAAMKKLS